jgi:hypothetical protein
LHRLGPGDRRRRPVGCGPAAVIGLVPQGLRKRISGHVPLCSPPTTGRHGRAGISYALCPLCPLRGSLFIIEVSAFTTSGPDTQPRCWMAACRSTSLRQGVDMIRRLCCVGMPSEPESRTPERQTSLAVLKKTFSGDKAKLGTKSQERGGTPKENGRNFRIVFSIFR